MSHALDAYGLKVTNAAPETVTALDKFGRDWIGYGPDLGVLFPAARAEPACALASAYAGLLHMSLEAAEGYRAAAPFLATAQSHAGHVTQREQAIVDAALAWSRQDYPSSLKAFERATELAPPDIVAAKWGQYLAFNLGDAPAMLRLARNIMPQHRNTAEAWGMLAFAQEQSHQLHLAEDSCREALALNPHDAWAQHALAHVYETHGRLDEGISFFEAAAPGWNDRSIFMREHNYWHLALFHLDRDEPNAALKIYDDHLWGSWPEFAQEQIGAISMLWRLELRGVDTGERWQPVIKKVLERGREHIWPFHDLHYVFAIARSGSAAGAEEFLLSLKRKAASIGGAWSAVAAPAAAALVAYCQGRYAESSDLLTGVVPSLHLIGGSHAQRDIFVQTWIDASLRANNVSAVAHALDERQRARPGVLVHKRDLERLKNARSHSTS
ncbi:MAG: tetratricopeptide repeat protein [Micropepsaceae bacterium]